LVMKRTMAPKSNKLILGGQSAGPTQKNQLLGDPDGISRSSSNLSKFFVWSPHCNVEVMLQRIDKVQKRSGEGIMGRHYFGIRSIKHERNNLTRFELVVRKLALGPLVKIFRKEGKKWGWYVREHKKYEDRTGNAKIPTKDKQDRSETVETDMEESTRWLKVGTINVNGARQKRDMVRYFLSETETKILALQETLIKPTHKNLYLPGYECFNVYGSHAIGERGVSVAVSRELDTTPVDTSDPYWITVRVSGGNLKNSMLVMSVYVNNGDGKGVRERKLKKGIRDAMEKYPEDDVLIMGDFNQTKDQVNNLLQHIHHNFDVLNLVNGTQTRRQGRSQRIIDHIATLRRYGGRQTAARINRKFDISDHWVVQAKLEVHTNGKTKGGAGTKRYNVNHIVKPKTPKEKGEAAILARQFTEHNRFAALADWLDTDEDETEDTSQSSEESTATKSVDAMVGKLTETIEAVADEVGVRRKPQERTTHLPRATKRLLRNRTKAFQAWDEEEDQAVKEILLDQYKKTKSEAKQAIKKANREQFFREIKAAARARRNDPREFWQWASRNGGWRAARNRRAGIHPVRHPRNGKLVSSVKEIGDAWKCHFAELASDKTGHSQTKQYWKQKYRDWEARPTIKRLNKKIKMIEVLEAIKDLKYNKAPGQDGIPSEVFKVATKVDDEEANPMLRCIYKIVSTVFESGEIPTSWQESEVVSLPKKGDLTNMGNWRGISLMNVALKILIKITAKRLNQAFEAKGLFTKSQAGFRTQEECPMQYASLLETCQRRSHKKKATYLCFVDLKKAYDTVPQGALFVKLTKYGVKGKMLAFIEELYKSSTITVRIGNKPPYEHSEAFPLLRGVRQGCPMSPVLFNIFINDLPREGRAWGAKINDTLRIPCAMFADDLALIAGTKAKMRVALNKLSEWLQLNEMEVGIAKCGLMKIMGNKGLEKLNLKISGMEVPIVEEYTYLGLKFRNDLVIGTKTIEGRVDKGADIEKVLAKFLSFSKIPTNLKIPVVKAVIMQTLLYGGEVFGMSPAQAFTKAQASVDRCLKRAVGINPKRKVSRVALWRECGVLPLQALATGRRLRALLKAPLTKTWLEELAHSPFKDRKATWLTGAERYLNTQGRKGEAARMIADATDCASAIGCKEQIRTAYKNISKGFWKEEGKTTEKLIEEIQKGEHLYRESQIVTKTGESYIRSRFEENLITTNSVYSEPKLANGMNAISRIRLNAMAFGPQLAGAKMIPREYLHKCPCCLEDVPETREHFLLHCVQWESEREEWLDDVPRQLAEDYLIHRNSEGVDDEELDEAVTCMLLGGSFKGRSQENWYGDCGTRRPSTNTEEEDLADLRESGTLFRMAMFLQSVLGQRQRRMWMFKKQQLRFNSTTSQSPNG